MTVQDHNKLLGIFFAIHAAIQGLGMAFAMIIYGGLGVFMIVGARKSEDKVIGLIFAVVAVVVVLAVSLLFVLPQVLAALKLLKNKPGAKFWGTFGAIVSLLSFPLGTALGVYALWFLNSEQGKSFYDNGSVTGYNPPPPPNSWQ